MISNDLNRALNLVDKSVDLESLILKGKPAPRRSLAVEPTTPAASVFKNWAWFVMCRGAKRGRTIPPNQTLAKPEEPIGLIS